MSESAEKVTLEILLGSHAGLDAAAVAELRAIMNDVTAERGRARAKFWTKTAREFFDQLCIEGYRRVGFDTRARRGVVAMACIVAMLRELIEVKEVADAAGRLGNAG